MTALVRVPDRSGSHIQRLLDAGADGLLVPQVSDADGSEAVRRPDDPPTAGHAGHRRHVARRPLGAHRPGRLPRPRSRTRSEAVQLEDVEALAQMDEILDVANLTAVFLGTGDLSLSSGLPPSAPELQDLTDKLLAATAARGLPCGTAVGRCGGGACGRGARVLVRDGQQRRHACSGARQPSWAARCGRAFPRRHADDTHRLRPDRAERHATPVGPPQA